MWRLIFNIILQVTFTCDVDYTCMVNSIRWYHTTPDNTTTTQLKVGHVSVFYSFQIRERPGLEEKRVNLANFEFKIKIIFILCDSLYFLNEQGSVFSYCISSVIGLYQVNYIND